MKNPSIAVSLKHKPPNDNLTNLLKIQLDIETQQTLDSKQIFQVKSLIAKKKANYFSIDKPIDDDYFNIKNFLLMSSLHYLYFFFFWTIFISIYHTNIW